MLEKMKELIAEQLGIDAENITPEKSLKEDLNADSLDLFELVTNLEDTYEIEIPAEDLERMITVQDVIDYLKNKGIDEE
jgi:acyl carrier protein